MSASDRNESPTDARIVPQGHVERAVGGSCLGGTLGGVLGVLIGGFVGGLPLFFPRAPDIEALSDMFTGFVFLLIGSAVGGVAGAVGGSMLGAATAVAKSDGPSPAAGVLGPNHEGEEGAAD